MKTIILFLGLLFSSFAFAQDLTLMTYNVRNGMGMDNKADLNRTARVINHVAPDVVAVQELDSMTKRNNRYVLKELAELCGMKYTYAASIAYQGGGYGIGILSKENPISTKRVALPGREEARSFLLAEFANYVFICTHFSLTKEDRIASVELLVEEMENYDNKPIFLAGDLNAEPESETINTLQNYFRVLNVMQSTYPASNPTETLDYIMGIGGAKEIGTTYSYVYDEPMASDHRPVVVGVRMVQPE